MSTAPEYLPEFYNGQRITFRSPYTMPGELVLANTAVNIEFPEGTFLFGVDKPFEIHRVKFSGSQGGVADPFTPVAAPAPGIDDFWRVRIEDISKNQLLTKNAQLIASLTESNTNMWPWGMPYTIVRSEGFQVTVDNLLTAPNRLRAAISFEGYLLVVAPASTTR